MRCAAPHDDHVPGRLRRGLCERHYTRQRLTGTTAPPALAPTLTRYRVDARGCHVYTGPLYSNGYGKLAREEHGTRLAHLAAWRAANPDAESPEDLDHLCRNRACINPAHLEPVTRSENLFRGHEARGTCRNGLHPYVRGGCKPCEQAKNRRGGEARVARKRARAS